jgi:hypothetical protein
VALRRRSRWVPQAILATILASLVAAFGVQSAQSATEAKIKCKGPALAKAPKLPAGYPKPPEVRYISAVQAGPTVVVTGYFAAGFDEALKEYKAAVARAHYVNLKTERDLHDAEINYAGGGTTGQIALRETCREPNTTFVQIKSRPGLGQTAPSLPTWFTQLRSAANDLVRETSLRDKTDSARAFNALDKTFGGVKSRLRVKAPDETAAITMWIEKADASLKAGNLAGAHTYAANIIKELSDAATKITGATTAPVPGLAGVFASLKQNARALDQEAGFQDTPGTKRELAAFTKLFTAHRAQIEGKSPKAEELIKSALARVATEVKAGDKVGIRAATKALIVAVNRAAVLANA